MIIEYTRVRNQVRPPERAKPKRCRIGFIFQSGSSRIFAKPKFR